MTDFGVSVSASDSKESKQDDIITALGDILSALGDASAAHQVVIQGKLDTLHADLAKLLAQATHTLVDGVVFNSAAEPYTSEALDVSDYRNFSLLIDLTVANAPTDIVIRVQFSDDDATYYNLMNGPFGDLRYEDTAGDKLEVIFGNIMASYMKVSVLSSGCDATNTFTLTVKAVLGK